VQCAQLGVTWSNLNGSGSKALEPGSRLIAPHLSITETINLDQWIYRREANPRTAVKNYDPDCKLKQGWGFAGEGQLNFEVTSSNVTLLPEAAGLFHRLSGTP